MLLKGSLGDRKWNPRLVPYPVGLARGPRLSLPIDPRKIFPKFFRYPVGLYSRVRLVRVPERREVANYALWLSGCCLAHEIAQRRFCRPCRSL
jgi:hypothetical protein